MAKKDRKTIPSQIKDFIFARANGHCEMCGIKLDRNGRHDGAMQAGHRLPLEKLTAEHKSTVIWELPPEQRKANTRKTEYELRVIDHPDNLICQCGHCNNIQGDRPIERLPNAKERETIRAANELQRQRAAVLYKGDNPILGEAPEYIKKRTQRQSKIARKVYKDERNAKVADVPRDFRGVPAETRQEALKKADRVRKFKPEQPSTE